MILTGKAAKFAETVENLLEEGRLGEEKPLSEDDQTTLYLIIRAYSVDPVFSTFMNITIQLYAYLRSRNKTNQLEGLYKTLYTILQTEVQNDNSTENGA